MNRLLTLLSLFLLCGIACAAPVQRLYVFGDSYSDSGRGFLDTDGPTAVVYLARRLKLDMVPSNAPEIAKKSLNFAVSGAATNENEGHLSPAGIRYSIGMKNQVAEFAQLERGGKIRFDPATTVFFLAGGLNDRKFETAATIDNLEDEITTLYALGARRFRVALLPEQLPNFGELGQRLNPALRTIPAEMRLKLSGVEIETSNWGLDFDKVFENAAEYGFTNTTDKCAGRAAFKEDATPCASPATHYFYHANHPSTAVHKIVGDMLYVEMMANKS